MSVREHEIAGWRAVTLENGRLRVTVLPDKGADIHELVDLASGVDVLFHAPWGLQPPGAPPLAGWDGLPFMANYEGTWQELFPSANDPCSYRGREIPFHGEVAILPWEVEAVGDDALRCRVRCVQTPFRLERLMRLDPERARLVLDETVVNEGDEAAHFVWGHHCVLGPPFIEAGCVLDAPVRSIVTIPQMFEQTARLEPGQRSAWPHAQLRGGGTADLSRVPGPEQGSHDDVYLTDLEAGYVAVRNPRLGLTFRLDWDVALFRWIIAWQPYGGAMAPPLGGAYALGVEPWVSRLPLEQAVEAGEAVELAPGATFSTTLTATIEGASA